MAGIKQNTSCSLMWCCAAFGLVCLYLFTCDVSCLFTSVTELFKAPSVLDVSPALTFPLAQFAEVLCYNPKCRGFDSRCCIFYNNNKISALYIYIYSTCSNLQVGAVCLGTALQAESSWVRFPMVPCFYNKTNEMN